MSFIIFLTLIFLAQAEITDGVIDMLENETNPITFSCQAIGEPVPNISWYFNGAMIDISDASKYIISNSSNGSMVHKFTHNHEYTII